MILSVCPNPSIDTYAWLENLNPGHTNRITKLKEFPGGKATHIAMALQELGIENTLMANWAGSSGNWIQDQCRQRGVKITGITLEGQNRKCYTFRSNNSKFSNTELLEPGPVFDLENWQQFKEAFTKEIDSHQLICISGSWPKGAPQTAYSQLIQLASKANKKVIIDCSGEQLKNCLSQSFFGIHINEDEAISMFNTNAIDKIIENLKPQVELIAITKGAKGLWLYYQGKLVHANVKIDKPISTVGAGDCLTAGIAYGLHNNLTAEKIATYGAACGAANCLHEELGELKQETVQQLLEKVVVKRNKLKSTYYAD